MDEDEGIGTLATASGLRLVDEKQNSSMDSREDDTEQGLAPRSGSSPTSRIAVQKVYAVIAALSEYKRFLVDEIGFGGVLQFPDIAKLNLKFSRWIMSKVDVGSHSIRLGPSYKPLTFHPGDFHKVFGIPYGTRNIFGPDADITPEAVIFIRECIGLSDKSAHSLKVAESFVLKDISASSSRLEKDCFKMSFVVFIMGHLLAPSTKHDYTSVDYWGALSDSDNIVRFNWCQYCYDALLDAVTKLQSELASSSTIVNNLSGCHLFFQVFLLDNIDLGIFNFRHDSIPRVSLFNGDRLKSMILMCQHKIKGENVFIAPPVRHHSIVCYTRHSHEMESEAATTPSVVAARVVASPVPKEPPVRPTESLHAPDAVINSQPDLCKYIHSKFPKFAASPLGCAIKQHNARCLLMLNQMKNTIVEENIRFINKVLPVVGQSTPLTVNSREHIQPTPDIVSGNNVQTMMPYKKRIAGIRLDMSAALERKETFPANSLAQDSHQRYRGAGTGKKANGESADTEITPAKSIENIRPGFTSPSGRQHCQDNSNLNHLDMCSTTGGHKPSPSNSAVSPSQNMKTASGDMVYEDAYGQEFDTPRREDCPQYSAEKPPLHNYGRKRHGSGNKEQCQTIRSSSSIKKARWDSAPDAPNFELNVDDSNEVNSPPKKIGNSECMSPRSRTKNHADNLVAQLLLLTDEIGDSEGLTMFGQASAMKQEKKTTFHTKFNSHTIYHGSNARTHSPAVGLAIRSWIQTTTEQNLDRNWVAHPEPRYITMNGHAIRLQLYSGQALDHELASLLIRRLSQLDDTSHRSTPGERSRVLFEPDLTSAALAGERVTELTSVQKQFTGDHITFNIANCRYVTMAASLPHGWCSFHWDMQEKEINVIDPQAYGGDDGVRLEVLTYAVDTLHASLFDCIEAFFTQWPCGRANWNRKFPLMTTTHFERNETGLCMLHNIRHFNGTTLTKPLTKAAIKMEQDFLLTEIIHIEGNNATLQYEALDAVTSAIDMDKNV